MRLRVSPRAMTGTNLRNRASVKRRSVLAGSAQNVKLKKGSRLSALNATNTVSNKLERANYQKMGKAADGLADRLSWLSQKAAEGGKSIGDKAKELVDYYNDTMKNLRQSSGILNQYYHQSLKEIALSNRGELEEIGIAVAADGALSLNRDKLESADTEKLKKVFGAESDFVKRGSVVAGRVADNAKANAQSLFNQYNAAGGLANSYLSRYNFRG